ncbi:MAG: ATP-binding cassette domain-containing protein [Fimbriimonadaceae bacterium]|nr:ATP-binding cassette domain-containing protein [Fimbriimonadaceae bacterium]
MAVLEVRGVSKSFGSVQALENVSLDLRPGEVHAILGENGAGKSTLVGILAGFLVPDSGTVEFQGVEIRYGHPTEVREAGLRIVHQHFMLVPQFTIAENIALGNLRRWENPYQCAAVSEASDLAERLGWGLDLESRVDQLSVGSLQRVEILRALIGGGSVLVLDEPTAVLTAEEASELLAFVRARRDEGMTVVLVTHKLREVFDVADRATVLRQGRLVATFDLSCTEPDVLAEAMVGGPVPMASGTLRAAGEEIVRIEELIVESDRGSPAVRGIGLSLRSCEVLAIGGVDGNGQVELAEALVGIRRSSSGSIQVSGRSIAYIPQDRQTDGLVLEMSIAENILLGQSLREWTRFGILRMRQVLEWAQSLMRRFDVRAESAIVPAGALSGGNQQKVVVARNLHRVPDLLVAVNPTRGLDLRAEAAVRKAILECAAQGAAVLLLSTDHDEIEALGDRVMYMESGRLVDRLVGSTL